MIDDVLKVVYGDEYDIALKRAQSDARKEYERLLEQKDRELEAMARELREFKLRYGIT